MAAMVAYKEFEEAFSSYIGVADVVTTNSGTSALHLAIEGKKYPSGSEIIVPEFSMIATALAPYYARCTPVYVDCDDTMNINVDKIEEAITDRTVAILITHVYGRICKMDRILELCGKYGLDLIEDCCEVHGAVYVDGPCKDKRVGSLGTGCFSFYRNKIVAAEEGGAVCIANDPEYAALLRDLKSMAFGTTHNYIHEHIGFNYRMPDAEAQLAMTSLADIGASLDKRKTIEGWYDEKLKPAFLRPKRDVVWIYDINCANPSELVLKLNTAGIEARHTFAPMSMQPCFGVRPGHEKLKAYELYTSTCYLPVYTTMTEADVENISAKVNALAQELSPGSP